jgi:twinkle protein
MADGQRTQEGAGNVANAVGKEPCPKCRENGGDNDGDNLARYDDGGAYCFSCGHSENAEGSNVKAAAAPARKGMTLIPNDCRPLLKRGIDEETCKHFNYGIGELKGVTVQVANYYDRDGNVVAQKIRDAKKNFMFAGSPKAATLFGQQKWRDGGKMVVITEGEIDALTVSQLQQNKWPVVSVPNGAQGAAKSIAKEIEWLESYDKVIFMFDMDKPGRDAASECAALLSPGKAFIAQLPLKDANACLMEGKGKAVISAMWDAKAYRPDGVISISEVADKAAQDIEVGRAWPWEALTDRTYGRRYGELYGFGGGTGCGKSTVFKQIAKHIIETENVPVGLIMLEEPPSMTAKTLAGMMMGQRVHVPEVEYDRDQLRATLASLDGRVYLYDHFGSMSFDVIKQKIRYMVRGLGVRDIFLDHLTALASAIGEDVSERVAIDKIMAELSSLCQELECTIYYVSHLTTPEGKAHEEGGRVLEKQFRGSRSIAYWSHFLFGIERDKQDEDGVTVFRVLKDRYTGDAAGLRFGLRYSTTTGLLDECQIPDARDKAPAGFTKEEDGEY